MVLIIDGQCQEIRHTDSAKQNLIHLGAQQTKLTRLLRYGTLTSRCSDTEIK